MHSLSECVSTGLSVCQIHFQQCFCRRMYDSIVLESTNLPAGVTLAAVLEGCDEREIASVLSHIPDLQNIQQEDLEASGKPCYINFWSMQRLSDKEVCTVLQQHLQSELHEMPFSIGDIHLTSCSSSAAPGDERKPGPHERGHRQGEAQEGYSGRKHFLREARDKSERPGGCQVRMHQPIVDD